MKTAIQHAGHQPYGAASVEYALLLIMVALVLVGVMASVETSTGNFWSNVVTVLTSPGGFGQSSGTGQ